MAKGPKKPTTGGMVRTTPIPWSGSTHYAEQKNFGTEKPGVSDFLLDKMAEETITGGYGSRNKLCRVCRMKKSLTGECYC